MRIYLLRLKEQITNEANEQDLVTTHTLFHQTLYKRLNNTLLENLIGVFSTFSTVSDNHEKIQNEQLR